MNMSSPATSFLRRLLVSVPIGVSFAAVCAAMLIFDAPEAHYRRALAAIEGNGIETASYELLWLERNPRFEAQASLLSGTLLVAQGELQSAPRVLAVAARDPDTNVRAMVLLGECLYKSERFQEAGEVWTKVLELDPDNLDAHRWLGIAYADLGAVREALVHLRRAAELDEDDPGPHRLIGRLCENYWQPKIAAESYLEALRRAPNHPDNDQLRFSLAKVYYRSKEYSLALDQLSRLAPSAEALALAADCQHGLGIDDQADTLLDEALRLNPKLSRALALRGQLLLERGDVQAATEVLELATREAPNDRLILHHLAMTCQRAGQKEKAERLRKAVDRLHQLDAQYEDLSLKAIDDPRDVQTRYRLGALAAELGAPALARAWFQAVVHLEPGNAQVKAALRALDRELEEN